MRKITFSDGEFYHIFNRGVDKRKVFLSRNHYIRFIRTLFNLMNFGRASIPSVSNQSLALKLKIDLICYVLMPNHYHLLIKQKEENGITEFMHKLDTSYTKYFNLNHHRKGRLFEYIFNAVQIEDEEQLLHVSRYIHLNPLIGKITSKLDKYQWSSYKDYIGQRQGRLCKKDEILNLICKDLKKQYIKYQKFVDDQISYAQELDKIKKVVID